MAIAKTTDGGATWAAYRPFPDDSLSYRGIGHWGTSSQPDFNKVALAGSRGKIVYTTDGGSNWAEQSPLDDPCQWWTGIRQSAEGWPNQWAGTSGTWMDWFPPSWCPRSGTDFG